MRDFYIFTMNHMIPLEEAWDSLTDAGVEIAYASDEEKEVHIYGYCDSIQSLPKHIGIQSIKKSQLPKIDWESQWALHGLNFSDGYVNIHLAQFGGPSQVVKLKPGPGFGDASHPTTLLVLKLMIKYLPIKTCVDIGCGSGVLTVAAALLGAQTVYAIDIDPEALKHAEENAKINNIEKECLFYLPKDFKLSIQNSSHIIMNMISSEQTEAWNSLPSLHHSNGFLITSGIRTEEKDSYLKLVSSWGWSLIDQLEDEEKEWLGFVFKRDF